MLHFSKAFVASSIAECNIGALIIRIGFGVYYTIITIRNPQNPILIIKAPTLPRMPGGSLQVVTTERPIVASWHDRVSENVGVLILRVNDNDFRAKKGICR